MSRSFSSVFPCTDTAASNSSKDLDWRLQPTDRQNGGGVHGGRGTGGNISTDSSRSGGGSLAYQINRECAARARKMDRLLSMSNQTLVGSARGKLVNTWE